MLAESNINSIDIKIVIIFFLLTKIPRKPMAKTEVERVKKWICCIISLV